VAANRFEAYEISSDPLSDRTKRQFAHWIDTCKYTHKRCPNSKKSLPKRVIDVRGEKLKLLDPSPNGSYPYVALSHCWGSCRDFLTTRENVEKHRVGFSLENLPATFRDAVLATRALDIPFLWIDSICILQGDKEDWELEGSKLANIYSDATITICASNSTDDAEGFLRTRQRPPIATLEILCPPSLDTGRRERSTRVYIHSEHDSRARKDYLSERAWCLQERYLSPRILSFEQDAIRWECFEATWSETSRQGHGSGDFLFSERDDEVKLHAKWDKMVEHYSRRALTYTTDTLPALSAVAARAAQATGDQYLSGLWKNELLRWLLWRRIRYAGGFNRPEHPPRSEIYHAASWSWASYAGSVEFQAPPNNNQYELFDSVTIVEATATVTGQNKYGSVDSAVLVLRATALELAAVHHSDEPPEEDWQGYQSHILSCPDLGIPNDRFKVILDYPDEERGGVIMGIPIVHHGGAIYSKYHVAAGTLEEGASDTAVRNLKQVYGLLIREKPGLVNPVFERVGVFQIGWTPMDRFLDALSKMRVQELKIV
jgi:hypothetical protein